MEHAEEYAEIVCARLVAKPNNNCKFTGKGYLGEACCDAAGVQTFATHSMGYFPLRRSILSRKFYKISSSNHKIDL